MANVDAPFGLRPIGDMTGAPYNGSLVRCYIPASDTDGAVFIGDLVKLDGAADANGVPGVSGAVSTADAVFGVVVSVEADTADSLLYRADATERYVLVSANPNTLYEVQEDGTSAATVVGATAQLTGFGTGSTVTGRSAVEISTANISETADVNDDVQILGRVQSPDNEVGANQRFVVRLNLHQLVNGATGV